MNDEISQLNRELGEAAWVRSERIRKMYFSDDEFEADRRRMVGYVPDVVPNDPQTPPQGVVVEYRRVASSLSGLSR